MYGMVNAIGNNEAESELWLNESKKLDNDFLGKWHKLNLRNDH